MSYRSGALCLVIRDGKILMVKHRRGESEYYTLPGGGMEAGESPEETAIRELFEECSVRGKVIRKLTASPFALDENVILHTFHVDIGEQIPELGKGISDEEKQTLIEVRWMALDEICERDRAFLWSYGLACIPQFFAELTSWSDDLSYPGKKTED